MKRKHLILFTIGGLVYLQIEMLWRGHTHWSMFLVGGLCFLLIGAINNHLEWEMSIVIQAEIGAVMVTAAEFIAGVIVNLWMGLGVWDYTNMPYNLFGQICLIFGLLWIPVSAFAIVLDDCIRWRLFGEDKPHYTLLGE